ncbi:MAG: hypothetical protein U1A28_01290, partial [Patescibacteria group bacterium]|nr:hypothetical protein [Patescibacteria group bacterium]
PSDTFNQVVLLRGITATTTLAGGSTIVFEKQTGKTANSGTIKLIHGTSLASTTMTLYSSGILSIP